LRLQDALARVVDQNPKLQAYRFAVAGAEAREGQAALRPAYEIGLEVENIFGTGQVRTFGDLEATLQLSRVFERGGKRQSRIDAASRARELLAIAHAAERLDIAAETARKFIEVLAAQEGLVLAAQSRDLARRTLDLANRRVEMARSSPVDASNARLALIEAEIEIEQRTTARRAAWTAMAAGWAAAPGEPGEVIGLLYELPPPLPFADLQQAIEQNPDILKFASEQRVNEAKLRLAETGRLADISAGVGLRRLQATKDQALVFSVSVPLGTEARSGSYEREARSLIDQSKAEEAAARVRLISDLHGLYQQLEGARAVFNRLDDAALPQAIEAERLTEEGFAAGRFSLLELSASRRAAFDVRERLLTKAATYHQLYLEIERLTGRSLEGTTDGQ
jgi:cobalt-zinc-cadmium efflux system outer membrane protein